MKQLENPDLPAKLRERRMTLVELRGTVERHNATPRGRWTLDETAQLVAFLGDLQHDAELIRELLAFPEYKGLPRLLRDDRLG